MAPNVENGVARRGKAALPLLRLLPAPFAMIRVCTGGFSLRLRHVLPFLGLAVVARVGAVIDVGRRIEPDHSRTTARRRCSIVHVGGGRLRRPCRSHRGRRRSGRGGCTGSRCRGRGRSNSFCRGCCRLSWSGSVSRKPLLHTLMTTTRTRLLGGIRVASVFALPGCAGGRSCRGLSHTHLTHANSKSDSDHVTIHPHPKTSIDRFECQARKCRARLLHTAIAYFAITSREILRFFWRPASVALSATGCSSP
jgi:hypothetical protein